MNLFIAFLLGVANFAAHRAVLESDHPILARMPGFYHIGGGRFGLGLEFAILTGAMLMIAGGSATWGWFYALYSAVNLGSAWLLLTGRI